MEALFNQAIETAMELTSKDISDKHTQEVAFKLACATAASIEGGKVN